MTVMTARQIASRSGGRVEGDADAVADVWAFDSRALTDGACFVALRGTRDGHDFVAEALAAGARVALVHRPVAGVGPLGRGRAIVHVDDTLVALQAVARSVRSDRGDLHVVAVAGSTGKTSTKDLLAAALAPRGCYANAESYNNEFGLPITLCNTPSAAHVVVTEMGERFPGDLALLCDIARPDVGVVTNVGLAHAEHLGGYEGTVNVLTEMLEALPASGTAVLNADDPASERLAAVTSARVVTVGTSPASGRRFNDVELDARLRPSFVLDGVRFAVPLHGAHHAANAAMAVVVAHDLFGVALADIASELATANRGRWRMELLETDDGVTILNDAYNANPTSMHAALVALAHVDVGPGGRRVAVLGDMRELGDHHDAAHAEAGVDAAAVGVDLVIGVGAGGAQIADAAAARGIEAQRVADAGAAVDLVERLVRRGDALLVKGSRALALEHVADALLARHRAETGEGAA